MNDFLNFSTNVQIANALVLIAAFLGLIVYRLEFAKK